MNQDGTYSWSSDQTPKKPLEMKKFADTMGDNNYEERKKFFKKFKK